MQNRRAIKAPSLRKPRRVIVMGSLKGVFKGSDKRVTIKPPFKESFGLLFPIGVPLTGL